VKVQTATLPIVLKLSLYRVCWFCHFTGCVGTVTIPLLTSDQGDDRQTPTLASVLTTSHPSTTIHPRCIDRCSLPVPATCLRIPKTSIRCHYTVPSTDWLVPIYKASYHKNWPRISHTTVSVVNILVVIRLTV